MDSSLTKVSVYQFDNTKILELIEKMPDISVEEKVELRSKILSNDVDLIKTVKARLSQSNQAVSDLIAVQNELIALNKQGMYMKSKQTIETGSGKVEIEMKGGDTKLIIPVLIIVAIVVIAVVAILFWN